MIRVARLGDADDILKIYAPIVTHTPISFELSSPSRHEIQERIKGTLSQYPWLVHEVDGRVVAYAYAGVFRARIAYQWSAEVTIYVDSKFYNRGIGKALYHKLFDILRKQGFRSAIGGITLPNTGSVAIHESMGFTKVAHFKSVGYKFGIWHDVGFWQLELQSHVSEPSVPIPFEASMVHSK